LQAAQAVDAADAVERLKAFAYDAMVVDLLLPDANGLEVLEEAVTRYPQLQSSSSPASGGVEDAVTGDEAGAIDFLIKPFQLAGLARVLQAPSISDGCAKRTPNCACSCATASGSRTSSGATAPCSRCSRRSNSSPR
jgi:DNA-binding response OmpR family regulator